jgi:transcription elongation factor Elf1
MDVTPESTVNDAWNMVQQYTFTCPECSADITVDAAVQDELLSKGCVVCNATISQTNFDTVQ